jgi:hypothetical protein
MKKLMYLTAATLLVAGLAVAPAFAQGAAKTTTKTATTKTATMKMKKSHHAMSCYDYAWDSQAQKDCLAGKKPMAKKATSKKSMKKAAPKKS